MLSCCLRHILTVPSKSSLRLKYLADRSSAQCGLLLLQLICLSVPHVVNSFISAYFGCSEWLFESLLPSCQLKAVWSFSSDINKAFSPREPLLTGYYLLCMVPCKTQRGFCVKIPADQPILHQQQCDIQSHKQLIRGIWKGAQWF